MHIPTVLYGYIIQASNLPFTTQHSPSLCRTIPTTTDDNNGKSTIPEDSDGKHYYYGYNILRQLSYSSHTSSFPGAVDSSITLAMDLYLLVALAK